MLLAHGGTVYLISIGLAIPLLAFTAMFAILGRRASNSISVFIIAYYSIATLLLFGLTDGSRQQLFGFETKQLRQVFQAPLAFSGLFGPAAASVICVLFARAISKETIDPKNASRQSMMGRAVCAWAKNCMIFISSLIVLSAICYYYAQSHLGITIISGNVKEWKKTHPAERAKIARSLVSTNTLLGESRSRIIELLGDPEEATLIYKIGDYVLCLKFDGSSCSTVVFSGDKLAVNPSVFDSTEWLSLPPERRTSMAIGLGSRQSILMGKSRDQIHRLLGPSAKEELFYKLGIGSKQLNIRINEGRVESMDNYEGR